MLYALRLMRRVAADLTSEVKAIVAAPAEVKELRAAVATNTEAIADLSSVSKNLASALDRVARIAERSAGSDSP